jgi:uncharacterized protein YecE (DUF72 family)
MSINQKSPWVPLDPPPDLTPRGFYVGTSGYYYDDWVGLFNPPKLSRAAQEKLPEEQRFDQDRLRFYQKYFSFVEINTTFYNPPTLAQFLDIEKRSRESMKYAVKLHRDISHVKQYDADRGRELMREHVTAVSPLVETGRFYSFLLQLEDHVYRTPERLEYLLAVCSEAVREHVDVHIEFRHNSWHTMHALQSLKDSGIGICNTDIPPVKHAFPLKAYATTDKGYIRYSGRNLANWYPSRDQKTAKDRIAARNARYDYLYSDEELQELIKGQIALSRKTSVLAMAYNNHYQIKAVRNAIDNIKRLAGMLEETNRDE